MRQKPTRNPDGTRMSRVFSFSKVLLPMHYYHYLILVFFSQWEARSDPSDQVRTLLILFLSVLKGPVLRV